MLGGKPTVFISHSGKFREQVAAPFRAYAESLGMNPILVNEMPTPEHGGTEPDAKVDYYLDRADMFVALMTPDDHTDSGEVHARPNVADEITRARMRPHLRARVQVFKARDVDLHTNINPTYELLDPGDIASTFPIFERQAVEWGILAAQPSATEPPSPAVGPIGPSETTSPDQGEPTQSARGQAAAAVARLQTYLLEPDTPVQDEIPSPIARAHLSASAALAGVRSISPFGVHELNGLYRERQPLKLTGEEERHLLRTMLLHLNADNAPGWYWFRTRSAADIQGLIIEFALGDPETSVRRRALLLLTASRRGIARADLRALLGAALDKTAEPLIRSAGLDLLAARADLRLVREMGDIVDPDGDGAGAVLTLRARETPVQALRILLAFPARHTVQIEADLLSSARRLPASLLRQALRSDLASLRLLALGALDRSGRLRKADVLTLIAGDPASQVRVRALRIALRRHWDLDRSALDQATAEVNFDLGEEDELRVAFHRGEVAEKLLAELKWIGDSSWNRYLALGEVDYSKLQGRIREDLETDFQALRDSYREEIEATIRRSVEQSIHKLPGRPQPGEGVVAALVAKQVGEFFADFDNLESFTLRRFRVAALHVLLVHGEAADVRLARDLIDCGDKEVAYECVRLLEKFGDAQDVDVLVKTAGSLYGDDALVAAQAALSLSGDLDATIAALIEIGDPQLIKAAVRASDPLDFEVVVRQLLPLLSSKDESVRSAVTDNLADRLSHKRQRVLIDVYIDQGGYYFYNVVTRLDRALYAPAWLRSSAARESP